MTQKAGQFLLEKPFAHRGLHDDTKGVPENSLPAFMEAIKKGYAIELDVHLLSDQGLVVFHDDTLERMCGNSVKIAALNSKTIKQYKLAGTEEMIPLLDEVLKIVNGQVPLLIEIKNTSKVGKLERTLAAALRQYSGHYAIQSFNPFSVGWFAKNFPEVPRGQLSSDFRNEKIFFLARLLLKNFAFNWKSKPDFIAYDFRAMPNKRVARFRKKNLYIFCWTIRSEAAYKDISPYCDNIIFENFEP